MPTIAEQGYPGVDVAGWFAVIAPARLPAADVRRIHDAFVAALATPEVREQMDKQGNLIQPATPEAAVQYFRAEQERYARIVRKTDIKVD